MTRLYTLKSYIKVKPEPPKSTEPESSTTTSLGPATETGRPSSGSPLVPKSKYKKSHKKSHGIYKSLPAANTKALLTLVTHYHASDPNAGLAEITRFLKRQSRYHSTSDRHLCKLLNRYRPRSQPEPIPRLKLRIKKTKLRTPSLIHILDSWRSAHPVPRHVPAPHLPRNEGLTVEDLTVYEFGKAVSVMVPKSSMGLDSAELVEVERKVVREIYLEKKKAVRRFVEESGREGVLDLGDLGEEEEEDEEEDECGGYFSDQDEYPLDGGRDADGDWGWVGGDEDDQDEGWGGEPAEWWVKKKRVRLLVQRKGGKIVQIAKCPRGNVEPRAEDWDGKYESLAGSLEPCDFWHLDDASDLEEEEEGDEGTENDKKRSSSKAQKEAKPDWDGSVMVID